MATICLIDDTPDLLLNLSEFLQMEGFEVMSFLEGQQALQYLGAAVPDLIITDLWMPAMDGLVLIQHVRNNPRLSRVPVIIFSAKALTEYEKSARILGVDLCLKKPADLDRILDAILSLLKKPL